MPDMIPLKWRIYRILNYVLLVASALLFLKFFDMAIVAPYSLLSVSTVLLFLCLVIQSIINLAVMANTFPGKLLTGAKGRWHLFSTIINGIAFAGLAYIFFSLLQDIDAVDYSENKALIVTVILVFTLILATALFIFICQLTFKKYLQRIHTSLVNSMIDSIGSDS